MMELMLSRTIIVKRLLLSCLRIKKDFYHEERSFLSEAPTVNTNTGANAGFSGGATATGPVAGFDPVLISLIRRSMPNLVAYDLAGVQPMNAPTGLIFAMRSRFVDGTNANNMLGTEALFNEPDSAFSGQNQENTILQTDLHLLQLV